MEKSKDSDYPVFCPVMSCVFDVVRYLENTFSHMARLTLLFFVRTVIRQVMEHTYTLDIAIFQLHRKHSQSSARKLSGNSDIEHLFVPIYRDPVTHPSDDSSLLLLPSQLE